MKKRTKGMFSLLLVICMLISGLPSVSFAADDEAGEILSGQISENTVVETLPVAEESGTIAEDATDITTTILEEDTSLRGEYEKHFLMSDGSYQVALYNEPVHQLDDGAWVEIDNTLALQTATDGTAQYTTANGLTDVSFSQSFGDHLVTMRQDDYSVSWGVQAVSDNLSTMASSSMKLTQPVQAELVAADLSAFSAEQQKIMATKSSSTIQYRNALQQNVDLEYIVLPSRVKENIILQRPQDISYYVVTVYAENLSARLLENRRIEFYNDSDKVIFTMASPYMYDNSGELSENIAVEMASKGNGCYFIKMTPDAQWLNAESRVYPVVIDPQVTTDSTRTNILDNFVLEGAGVQNNNLDRLYIGNRSGGRNRAYIRFATMPTIPTGSTITAATMTLKFTNGTDTAANASAYQITGNWTSSTITWSTRPTASTRIALNISHNNLTGYTFSCLATVRSWYSGSPTGQNANYGVMMRYYDESIDDYNAVYSADYSDESKRPSMTITYQPSSNSIDGVCFIKYGSLCLSVDQGMIPGSTLTLQAKKSGGPAQLRQLWKIETVGQNLYSIRSMYRPDLALHANDNGTVDMATLDTAVSGSSVPSNRRWGISQEGSTYSFKFAGTAAMTMQPKAGALSPGTKVIAGVATNPPQNWTLEPASVSNQVLLINTEVGLPATNAVRYVTPGETITLSDMDFKAVFVSQHTNYQNIQWTSGTPSVATVNKSTGAVTGVSEGPSTITASNNGSTNSVSYTVKVLPIPDGEYFIRNCEYGRYLQIDNNDASNGYGTSGSIMEQWAYNGGNHQKWRITSLSNGYYSIISVKSGLALSVPSGKTENTDVSLVQEAYQGLDRQKWTIIETDNYCYKIKPKSSVSTNTNLVMAVGHFDGSDPSGVNIEQRNYVDDSDYRDEWQICSFVDIGMSTDNYAGGGSRSRKSDIYANTFYNELTVSPGLPSLKIHKYNNSFSNTASIDDFAENGAISNDIDFMIFIGHGHDAHIEKENDQSTHKKNHIQYSHSTTGAVDYTDVCANTSYDQDDKETFCLHTDDVNFGSSTSDLRWIWMYTCNFLTPVSGCETNASLKKMMTGAHILMGYASQSTLCNPMATAFANQLRAGETFIDSFFYAGENGESYEATSDHTQKILFLPQAQNETIYSPKIHYEYDSNDIQIIQFTFEGRKIQLKE